MVTAAGVVFACGLFVLAVLAGRWLAQQNPPYDSRDAYQLYLDSAGWHQLRELRLAMDGYRCVGCGRREGLHVHHITYERFGDEDVERDLVTVCVHCHARIHAYQKHARCTLWFATGVVLGQPILPPVLEAQEATCKMTSAGTPLPGS